MAPCCNQSVKLTLNSSQERNRLEPLWQPYFLLLVGWEWTQENFCGFGVLEVNFLGWPTPILKKYGGGGTKYHEGSHI